MTMIPDNSRRAQQVILLFWILLVASAAMTVSTIVYLAFSQDVNEKEGLFNSIQYFGIALLNLGISIGVIVTFIQWFRRAYHNLSRAGYTTKYEEQYAVGYWFFPFLSLFRPYQIMKEIWYTTQIAYAAKVERHMFLRIWWILFLLKSIVDAVVGRIEEVAIFPELISLGVSILAILVTISVIRKVSYFESQFAQHLMVQAVGQPVANQSDTEESFY